MANEPDSATKSADMDDPAWYMSKSCLPPKRFSAQPAGMAPKPNIKPLIETTNPNVLRPTSNSLRITGIKLGNANIRAWTDR